MNRQTCNRPESRPAPAPAAPLGGLRGSPPTDAATAGIPVVSRPPRAVRHSRRATFLAVLLAVALIILVYAVASS